LFLGRLVPPPKSVGKEISVIRLVWIDGRFAWPFMIALVFVTASAVIVDFIWRVAVISFKELLIYACATDAVAIALIIAGYLAVRRPHSGLGVISRRLVRRDQH
jgi:hypothetical protein